MGELLKGVLDATQEHVFETPGDPIPRDRWGRPLVVPPDGGKPVGYTRATTFAGTVEDTYNLGRWQMRMVATGLALRPDLLMAAFAAIGDKRALNEICQQAIDAAEGRKAANVGTAIHSLTEKVDRGEELGPVPEEFLADLRAYWKATKRLEVARIENFVVVDSMKVGGTFDRLVKFEGEHFIADVKTGSLDWAALKIAIQLALYSRGVLYDHATKERTPLPEVNQERGIVIHLPAGTGTCELKWIDLAAGWEAAQLAKNVRGFRARKDLLSEFK